MKAGFYEHLLDNLFDGVYYVDTDRRILFWNRGAERITGYSRKEVLGSHCYENLLRHIDEEGNALCEHGCPLHSTIRDRKVREADVFLHHKNGHRVSVTVRVTPMVDDEGEVIGAVEIFTDNSKRIDTLKELERLRQEVLIDALTGVGNRRLAELRLSQHLSENEQLKTPCGIVFLDIDRFKDVNDTYGHITGDQVLKMVANTISGMLRPMDTIARWGGEEFLVIAPNIPPKMLQPLAERLRLFVSESWLHVGDGRVRVTISSGATMLEAGDTAESAVGRADGLMYKSKESGRDRVTVED